MVCFCLNYQPVLCVAACVSLHRCADDVCIPFCDGLCVILSQDWFYLTAVQMQSSPLQSRVSVTL